MDSTDSHPSLDKEGAERLLQQAFELWINPEIERRRAIGELKEPFSLQYAQRLQWPDGNITIRLNEEVQGIAFAKANRDVRKGDPVLLSDIEHLEAFDLHEDELDCGHWTVIWTGKSWFTGFNFLSNRGKCADLLNKSAQFLIASLEAHKKQHAAVAVDTLFSACELIAKAELVSSHQIDIDVKSHGSISNQINLWRKHGNIESAFVELMNNLSNLRKRYRYDAHVSQSMPISEDDLSLVEAMISASFRRVGQQRLADLNDDNEAAHDH